MKTEATIAGLAGRGVTPADKEIFVTDSTLKAENRQRRARADSAVARVRQTADSVARANSPAAISYERTKAAVARLRAQYPNETEAQLRRRWEDSKKGR